MPGFLPTTSPALPLLKDSGKSKPKGILPRKPLQSKAVQSHGRQQDPRWFQWQGAACLHATDNAKPKGFQNCLHEKGFYVHQSALMHRRRRTPQARPQPRVQSSPDKPSVQPLSKTREVLAPGLQSLADFAGDQGEKKKRQASCTGSHLKSLRHGMLLNLPRYLYKVLRAKPYIKNPLNAAIHQRASRRDRQRHAGANA